LGPTPIIAGTLVLTGLVIAASPIPFAYPLPGAAFFVACLSATSAFAVAALFHLQYERSHRVDDLLISVAFGVTAILEGTLPLMRELWPATSTVSLWSTFTLRGVVSLVLCLAAWLPNRTTRMSTRAWTIVAMSVTGAGVIVLSTTARLSTLEPAVYGLPARDTALTGEPSVLAFRLASCIFLFVAAYGFSRRARGQNDDVMRWLAAGAVLLGVARFHDFLFPSLRSDWLTTGDMLRVAAQILLILSAYRALDGAWQRRAGEAADAERVRMASELHDGLAQELAYLCADLEQTARRTPGEPHLSELAESADRALTEARFAIAEFSRTDDVRLDRVLADVAGDLGRRHHRQIELDVDEVAVDSRIAYELARVGKEAMSNAVRHASADRIVVRLSFVSGEIEMSVTDDGRGFTPGTTDALSSGFGMRSMQERVKRMDGRFTLAAGPSRRGTKVLVAIPRS
jgi:signal transduction histidine kinase